MQTLQGTQSASRDSQPPGRSLFSLRTELCDVTQEMAAGPALTLAATEAGVADPGVPLTVP